MSRVTPKGSPFEREAKLLAALNHPGIATLYGVEEHEGNPFLVMEFVDGETLGERIARGRVPVSEAIPLFVQIAEALEAAHGKGIIHRDLKPPNIKITSEGNPKLLDFGLARAFHGEEPREDASQSPTLTKNTALGTILGTAAYMSPEQARVKTVDKRTDNWAFGCCLYEALTGKAVFRAGTVSDTIANVLQRDPDWDRLPSETPGSVRDLLKNRPARFGPSSWSPDGKHLAYTEIHPSTGWDIWILSAGEDTPRAFLQTSYNEQQPAFSPDGHWLAYASDESGQLEVYVQPFPSGDRKWQISTDRGTEPRWSHDGRELFFRDYGGEEMLVARVSTEPDFRPQRARILFEGKFSTYARSPARATASTPTGSAS